MAIEKFIALDVSGNTSEKYPVASSTGVADAGRVIATDGNGKLDVSLMPDGIGADVRVCPAFENLSAGDLINLFSDTGTLKARKADASGGVAKQADGYVKSAVASGATATVYLDGTITGLTGLTMNSSYFLSATTPGAVSLSPATTANHILQRVGRALSTTELNFEPNEPIIRA